MKRFTFALFFLLAAGGFSSAFELPADSKQCLVGIANDWNDSSVTLTLYEKKATGWKKAGSSWSGRLGKNGLVWGKGLHPVPAGAATKKEGDRRAPAGVFDLGGAWGYAPSIKKSPNLNYVQVTTRDLWYEDTSSPYYNQYRRIDHEPSNSSERKAQMKQGDHAHSLKLFIAHNAYPNITPGGGSSIFFHIWRNGGGSATFGCTTMAESNLKNLIATVEPAKRPVYVLLPKAEYEQYRGPWKLP
ncbi:MAG: L,D-transpeptidase family protein [Verrucomicrobiales bacterium]|nr:L,D-transpeptidase family protein [Verrucomicrobiales bacterium]